LVLGGKKIDELYIGSICNIELYLTHIAKLGMKNEETWIIDQHMNATC